MKALFFIALLSLIGFTSARASNPIRVVNHTNCDITITYWCDDASCNMKATPVTIAVPANSVSPLLPDCSPDEFEVMICWAACPNICTTVGNGGLCNTNTTGTLSSCGQCTGSTPIAWDSVANAFIVG